MLLKCLSFCYFKNICVKILLGLAKVATKYNFSSNSCVHSNTVSRWTSNSKWWTCEWVSKFKGAKKNLLNIFHVISLNIIEIFSCHVDFLFVTWQNILWQSHKYFGTRTRVQHKNTNYSTNGCIYLFKWCFWFEMLMWEGFEKWKL
jgi:hypothetical protein